MESSLFTPPLSTATSVKALIKAYFYWSVWAYFVMHCSDCSGIITALEEADFLIDEVLLKFNQQSASTLLSTRTFIAAPFYPRTVYSHGDSLIT